MGLQPGQTLGSYRLTEKIGEGGMGVVWKALDPSLNREVAIKTLPEAFTADPERLARFEREARLLASLNHPHIASVFGFHAEGDLRYLALEYLAGEDLSLRLAGGPLETRQAVRIALQVAEALEAVVESQAGSR